MERIPLFSSQNLEAACKVLGDTERGLTGSEIGHLLQEVKVADVSADLTKWKRLFNALTEAQNKYQVGNHLIMFINRALNPVGDALPDNIGLRPKSFCHVLPREQEVAVSTGFSRHYTPHVR